MFHDIEEELFEQNHAFSPDIDCEELVLKQKKTAYMAVLRRLHESGFFLVG